MNSIRLPGLGIVAAASLFFGASASAQLLVYDFSNQDAPPTFHAPGVSGSDFLRDPDHFISFTSLAGNPAPSATSGGFDALSFDNALYYTFTLTAGNALTITGLSFDVEASISPAPNGPTNFVLRSSLDGFTANLSTGTITPGTFSHVNVTQNVALGSGANVEYRIYAFGATDSGGQFLIDNITVVPEPSSSALFIASVSSGLLLFRLRRFLSRII